MSRKAPLIRYDQARLYMVYLGGWLSETTSSCSCHVRHGLRFAMPSVSAATLLLPSSPLR